MFSGVTLFGVLSYICASVCVLCLTGFRFGVCWRWRVTDMSRNKARLRWVVSRNAEKWQVRNEVTGSLYCECLTESQANAEAAMLNLELPTLAINAEANAIAAWDKNLQ